MCFGKRKLRAIWISTKTFLMLKCWICENDPQSYLTIQYSWNNPNQECFYLVIQVGSTHINNISGLTPTVVTWDSKLTRTQRPFWVHKGAAKKKKKCYMDSRSSQIYLPKHIKNLYFRRNVFYFLSIVTLTFQLFCLVVLSSVCYVCFYQALGLSKWRNKINLIHLNRT